MALTPELSNAAARITTVCERVMRVEYNSLFAEGSPPSRLKRMFVPGEPVSAIVTGECSIPLGREIATSAAIKGTQATRQSNARNTRRGFIRKLREKLAVRCKIAKRFARAAIDRSVIIGRSPPL